MWGGDQCEMAAVPMGRPNRQAVGLNLYDCNLSDSKEMSGLQETLGSCQHIGTLNVDRYTEFCI